MHFLILISLLSAALTASTAPFSDPTLGPLTSQVLLASAIDHPLTAPFSLISLPEGYNYASAVNSNGVIPFTSPNLGVTANSTTTLQGDPKISLHCQTSLGSPDAGAVWANGEHIQKHSNHWCCQMLATCTRLTELFSTKTDICGRKGRCVVCWWAGHANKWIASSCKNKATGKAGGYVRFGDKWVDVNAYFYFGDREMQEEERD